MSGYEHEDGSKKRENGLSVEEGFLNSDKCKR